MNLETIKNFFDALWEGKEEVREIRALDEYSKSIYVSSALEALGVLEAESYNKRPPNFYITLNPLEEECKLLIQKGHWGRSKEKSAKDDHAKELKYLLVDLDPKRKLQNGKTMSGICSTGEELQRAYALVPQIIGELGNPYILAHSGNGYHLIYKHDTQDEKKLRLFLRLISEKFVNEHVDIDLKVFNPSRITRIIGTNNVKGEPSEARPHRESRILSVSKDSKVLEIDNLEESQAVEKTTKTTKTPKKHLKNPKNPQKTNDSTKSLEYVKKVLGEKNITFEEDTKGDATHFHLISGCVFNPEHAGKDADIIVNASGLITYHCFHNSCEGKTWNHVKEILGIETVSSEKFWFFTNDKNGNKRCEISPLLLLEFLGKNGFGWLYPQKKETDSILIRIEDNIICPIDVKKIYQFLVDFIGIENFEVMMTFLASAKKILTNHLLNSLPLYSFQAQKNAIQIKKLKGTQEEQYIVFQNGVVVITPETKKMVPLEKLDRYVFSHEILQHNYKEKDYENFDFNIFLQDVCTGKHFDAKRYGSLVSAIGYLLCDAHPSNRKAIIFSEENIDLNEAQGGTGKSLIVDAMGKIRIIAEVDGKKYQNADRFSFSGVTMETKIISICDIKESFDFSSVYNVVTGAFTFEKKGQDMLTFDYEDSPKTVITTNYIVRGSSDSDLRRQHIVELCRFYNKNFTPIEKFGKQFFYGWNAEEWQMFYSMMLDFLQKYLKAGLAEHASETKAFKEAVNRVSKKLWEYLEDIFSDEENENEYPLNVIYENFTKTTKISIGKNNFVQKLKIWAEYKGHEATFSRKIIDGKRQQALSLKKIEKIETIPAEETELVENWETGEVYYEPKRV